jgi:hypothetical protein
MTIQWQEHKLSDVMAHFVDGFEPKDGKKVVKGEWFIDTTQNKVVFKLYVENAPDAPK